jgi:hypothetical protein
MFYHSGKMILINRKNAVLYRKNDRREGKMPFIITVYIRAYSIKENSFHQKE